MREVEEALRAAEAAVAPVEDGVHKATLFFAHSPFGRILYQFNNLENKS